MIPIDACVHSVLYFFFSRRSAQYDSSTSRTSTLEIDTDKLVTLVPLSRLISYAKKKERQVDYAIIEEAKEEALSTTSDKDTPFRPQSYLTDRQFVRYDRDRAAL